MSDSQPYRVVYIETGAEATKTPKDRDEAAELAQGMHDHGFDVNIMRGDELIASYADKVHVRDGYYVEDPRGYQSTGLHQIIQRAFGDTGGAAVHERRCIKEPMGCGKPYANVCRTEFGGERPCVEAKGHEGDHTDQDNYGGNMAVWTTFRSQAHFDEWTLTGLCQDCQDRLDKASEEAAIAAGEDPGPSWLDHTHENEERYLDTKAAINEALDMMSSPWPDDDQF